MSLSAHDRRALGLIEEGVAGSDPHLAAMLSAFSRLADGEAMPGHERIEGGRRDTVVRAGHIMLPARPGGGRPGTAAQRLASRLSGKWVALVWLGMLLTSLVVITVVLSHTSTSAACASRPLSACGHHAVPHRQSRTLPKFAG